MQIIARQVSHDFQSSVSKLIVGTECQALDWKNHKLLCKSFNLPRPNPNTRRGLYFPGGDEPGRFEWVDVMPDGYVGETIDRKKYLEENGPDRENSVYSQIQARDMTRSSKHRVEFFCRTDTFIQPSNQGVVDFTRAHACGPCWRGPVLAMSMLDSGDSGYRYIDMDMLDVRHAADHFSSSHRARGTQPKTVLVQACIVSCPHDISNGHSPYSERIVVGSDPVFYSGGSGIANLLGLPLLIRKDVRLDDSNLALPEGGLRNEQAMFLKRDIVSTTKIAAPPQSTRPQDMEAVLLAMGVTMANIGGLGKAEELPGFGCSPSTWAGNDVGSIIIARADGKPLIQEHAEVICEYLKQCVEPILETAIRDLNPKVEVPRRKDILRDINKTTFLDFFDRFRASKVSEDRVWKHLPSPYDIDSARTCEGDMVKAYKEQVANGVLPWHQLRDLRWKEKDDIDKFLD